MKELYEPKEKSQYFNWVREDLVNFLSNYTKTTKIDADNVLEIGCAKGKFGNYFKDKYQVKKYIGLDLFESAIEAAKNEIDVAICDDIEHPSIETQQILSAQKFDFIVLADVLEHLQNPWDTLKYMNSLLSENGKIMISIPNAGNIEVLKKLAFDKFEYEERGILDRTHLRFFTRHTILNMINYANLDVEFESTNNDFSIFKIKLFNFLTFGAFKKWFIRQYFFVVKNRN